MLENLGVSGRLKAVSDWLTTYWTAARAAKVDNLDAAISTRAAAATAVSNVDYTSTRAAKLDLIIGGSVIKSMQSGTFTAVSAGGTNVTLGSAVVVAKSIVLIQNEMTLVISGFVVNVTGVLTTTTNLQLNAGGNATTGANGRWTVLEFA